MVNIISIRLQVHSLSVNRRPTTFRLQGCVGISQQHSFALNRPKPSFSWDWNAREYWFLLTERSVILIWQNRWRLIIISRMYLWKIYIYIYSISTFKKPHCSIKYNYKPTGKNMPGPILVSIFGAWRSISRLHLYVWCPWTVTVFEIWEEDHPLLDHQ